MGEIEYHDVSLPIPILMSEVERFCKKWRVQSMWLFGSVLRDDFTPESDVDVMIRFREDANWTYWDYPDMTDELERIFGRKIDLVEERALGNPFRRRAILASRRLLYAA